jgi:exosortase A-associated hydrolase 2
VSRAGIDGRFIDGAKGPIFVLRRRLHEGARGCLLVVPPFAEEMNKCRRMTAEMSMALALRGWTIVQPDLYGTGDSGGGFVEADLPTWQRDLAATARWAAQAGHPVDAILAIRLGAALAQACLDAAVLPRVRRSVLWQPVFDGARFLKQFWRLRVAASAMSNRRESLSDLVGKLGSEGELEVAGYRVSRSMAEGVGALAAPTAISEGFGDVLWLEAVPAAEDTVTATSEKLAAASRSGGRAVDVAVSVSEPFWASTEIVSCREMIDHTVRHLVDGETPGRAAS